MENNMDPTYCFDCPNYKKCKLRKKKQCNKKNTENKHNEKGLDRK